MEFIAENLNLIIQGIAFAAALFGVGSTTYALEIKKILKISKAINTILIKEIEENKNEYTPKDLKHNIQTAALNNSVETSISLHDLVRKTDKK